MTTQSATLQIPRTAFDAVEQGFELDGCKDYEEQFTSDNTATRKGEIELSGFIVPFTERFHFGKPRATETKLAGQRVPRTALEADERGFMLVGWTTYDQSFTGQNSAIREGEIEVEAGWFFVPFTSELEFGEPQPR